MTERLFLAEQTLRQYQISQLVRSPNVLNIERILTIFEATT